MFSLNVDKVPPEVTYGWKGKNADLLRDLEIVGEEDEVEF